MLNNKYRKLYEIELLKQTNPYRYYTEYVEQKIKGEDIAPFICVEENDIYKIYDAAEYFIYESNSGHSSDDERTYLIEKAKKLNADLIYSDSDYINNSGIRFAPFFKPDWSPDYYKCYDFVTEFYAVKKELNNACIEKMNKIEHVSKVLFHNVSDENVETIYEEVSKKIITPDYLLDEEIKGDTVSIVIPSKDNPDMLKRCIDGVITAKIKSSININEVVIVDNGSSSENREIIEGFIHKISDVSIIYCYDQKEFNFSAMCNQGAEKTSGEYILFLNDDIEVVDQNFIVKMLYYARMNHVGAVGAKLIYPGGNVIQHTGLVDLKFCGPSHKLSTFSDGDILYYGRNRANLNCLAVTGACLMVSRQKYFLINGFHDKMKVGYNDVDLCISLYEKGLYNVVVNDTLLIHHESVSRGNDLSYEKNLRLKTERDLLYKRHPFVREKGDPFYNKNLAGDFLDYRVDVIPDYENREYRSIRYSNLEKTAKRLYLKYGQSSAKNSFCNIESNSYYFSLFNEGDAVVISGWALINKRDNVLFDRYLCVYDKEKDEMQVFDTSKQIRKDVKDVFIKAKNAELAGFVSKLSTENIDYEKEYEYGILFVSKCFGRKYYAGFNKSDI